jgi:hypothetical protein
MLSDLRTQVQPESPLWLGAEYTPATASYNVENLEEYKNAIRDEKARE